MDASSGSGSVLIVNPNEEVVVLPGLTFIGNLVPVAAISVAMEDTSPPVHDSDGLPEYLEDTHHWVNQADNSCGTSYCGTGMFFSGAGGASYRPDFSSST